MKCFKDHDSDYLELNAPTLPIPECESYFIEENGKQVEVVKVPILTGEGLWRIFQREAEEIVAPGGVLIADPRERNRAINAAYARLWLHDNRFQWAGLAAFASKQVGCGLLHAADWIEKIQTDFEARQRLIDSAEPRGEVLDVGFLREFDDQAYRDFQQFRENNPAMFIKFKMDKDDPSFVQERFLHVYKLMALGNTTLFLDVFPLHAFYAKRGLRELKQCLSLREKIYGHPRFPVLWPVAKETLEFGKEYEEIIRAFEAIDAGDIEQGVVHLATHEQGNILESVIYKDWQLMFLLIGNHFSYVTRFPSGVAQAVELTLASQCTPVDDGRTIGFSDDLFANLASYGQRMPFVLNAATRFNELLNGDGVDRLLIEQSIEDIAAGLGVR